MLKVKNLIVSIEGKSVVKNLNVDLPVGEIHIVMGPNGVGKSTLVHALMGGAHVRVEEGEIWLHGQPITKLDTCERSKRGLFLAFQYPVAVGGLKISEFLRNLYQLHHDKTMSVSEFRKYLKDKLDLLKLDRGILSRYLNEGFSGGEMKRLEMLQLLILQPKVAILDEIDSGVDVDAQKIVAEAIFYAAKNFHTSFLIVTHYQRLTTLLQPNKVHIMLDGCISRSGGLELVEALEKEGYAWMKHNPEQNFIEG